VIATRRTGIGSEAGMERAASREVHIHQGPWL
jgi:hypothetical protein